MASLFGYLAFDGGWRRYQELALDAFERDRTAGRRQTYIVAPPGSGKTLIGLEMVRRIGTRALVLAPNSAVQGQWIAAAGAFGAQDGLAAADPDAPIACLTYQALTRLDDPQRALRAAAERRWTDERSRVTGSSAGDVEHDVATWTGTATARRDHQLDRIVATLKRELARGNSASFAELLSSPVRDRLAALRRNGVGTVVLDECHHLASLWGYVVRAVVAQLPEAHIIGLTATPPDELPAEGAALYRSLLGDVDFTIPTPAVVRDGFLAPFQELAWLTRPLPLECDWLAEHDARFQELVTALHDDSEGATSLAIWILTRMQSRTRAPEEGAGISWAAFQRAHPSLARAGVRYLATNGFALPAGVPRGEAYRVAPTVDDWLVLLEDYALNALAADASPQAAERYDAVAAGLRAVGFSLTRQGIRRGRSDVDRLLTMSAAKSVALVEVVSCELDARGDGLRALVLTDAERASAYTLPDGMTVFVQPDATTAPGALRALAGDPLTAAVRPLLVTGRGLRCTPADAPALLAGLRTLAPDLTGWWTGAEEDGLVELAAAGPAWRPRRWVELATRLLSEGGCLVLVGTRALLGEGWDAPRLNCLVDLTAATTATSVTQMRGRSLRLDQSDPEKIASNWDVVCVAPELVRGSADYERFVRKHLHIFAPTEDGEIEAGPSHVHPALGPFGPPPDTTFAEINRSMRARALEHAAARKRWAIGTPYVAEEHETLVVRPRHSHPRTAPRLSPPRYRLPDARPLAVGAAVAVASPFVAVAAQTPLALLGLAAAPLGIAADVLRAGRARQQFEVVLPLDLAARAVCDAYRSLGELSEEAAASLAIEPRASGYLRCYLKRADAAESARFAAALDQLAGDPGLPRYVVSRLVPVPGTRLDLARKMARRKPLFDTWWTPVPDDLARTKARATAFAEAWARWLGPSTLLFTQRTEEGLAAAADAASRAAAYDTTARRIWV